MLQFAGAQYVYAHYEEGGEAAEQLRTEGSAKGEGA